MPRKATSPLGDRKRLLEAVSKSTSITDCLKFLNLRAGGGNFKQFHKWVNYYEIDTSHFTPDKNRAKALFKTAVSLKEVLIEDSTYSRSTLKKRLYSEGFKVELCEECGQGPEWRGKKISLILDHVNGVFNDNRLSNLRILCPNCNAALDTHCGKHKRKLRPAEVNPKWRYGPKYDRRKVVRPSYEALKADVKELGFSGTGRRYNVSDNAIRKWIKIYENDAG